MGRKVEVEFEEAELTAESGKPVAGLCATCSECGEQVEVFGTGTPSKRRACVMLKEACPEEAGNFYTFDDEED